MNKKTLSILLVCNMIYIGSIASLVVNRTKVIKGLETQVEQKQNEIYKATEDNEKIQAKYNATIEQVKDLKSQIDSQTEQLENARQKIEIYNRLTSFNSNNVTSKSNATIVHMKRALKGTHLYKDAKAFIDAEKKYGVNAYFMASIAAQESSWGTSSRARNQNNLTGHAVYNSFSRGSSFDSRYDSIMSTAMLLKNEYLTKGGHSFNGLSVTDINKRYCFLEDGKTIDFHWSSATKEIANSLKYKANNFKKI